MLLTMPFLFHNSPADDAARRGRLASQWGKAPLPDTDPEVDALFGAYAKMLSVDPLGIAYTLLTCIGVLANGATAKASPTSSITSPLVLYLCLVGATGCGKVRRPCPWLLRASCGAVNMLIEKKPLRAV